MDKNYVKWKFKKGVEFFTKAFKAYVKSANERMTRSYVHYYQKKKIKKNVVLYEAFYGRGLLCGPFAIFEELLKNPEYSKLKHVWVLDKFEYHKDTIKKYKKYSNVKFVEYNSKKYLKTLASAKYLFNNSTFSTYFIKKEGQIYVNTWHGIPLKNMGYDEPTGAFAAANTVRNFLHVDYLISANPFLTDVYLNAYKQKGVSGLKIIEEGYPRLDTIVNTSRETVYEELRKSGVSVDENKKIILYAPTWKGANFSDPDLGIDEFVALKEKLEATIDVNKYQVLVKVHQVVYNKIREELSDLDYLVPATMDANVILSATDILISDYSSIYFDYLATGRPLLFYIPDIAKYSNTRGMYFTVDELPGPYTSDLDTLADWVNDIDNVFANNIERYNKTKDWCCDYELGSISKKVVDVVFGGNIADYKVVECGTDKKKILLSRGPMLVNGITTAFINVLNQIDYDKYDVTVLVNGTRDNAQKQKIMELNPNARVLVKPGAAIKTLREAIRNNIYLQCGPRNKFFKAVFPKKIYQREFTRLLGSEKFDYIVDYEGYNLFFATVCLMQPSARTCIWLHNDMLSEYNVRFKWLKKIFALYPSFDRIISCSKQIMEVNRENFSDKVPYEKFLYAKNSVNFNQVILGMENGKILSCGEKNYYAIPVAEGNVASLKLIPLQPETTVSLENGTYNFSSSNDKIDNGVIRFVSVGRLSPEKNQAELIKAFARVVEEYKNAMLYILGEGPSRKELTSLITSLELEQNVILTGNLSNPFGMMKQCDCFILPSIHEGQPLVIFEARLVHLPIIVSNFSSVGGSLIENGQYRIDQDEDSIYDGLKAFLEGRVPDNYVFDHENYNVEAYKEFEAAVFED